jgi:hypothetical protein
MCNSHAGGSVQSAGSSTHPQGKSTKKKEGDGGQDEQRYKTSDASNTESSWRYCEKKLTRFIEK